MLLSECLGFLAPERGGLFVDCTVGLGGHAEAVLQRGSSASVVGIDRDPQALEHAQRRLHRFGDRVRLVESNFAEAAAVIRELGMGPVAGVLADLGVSSLQLDRGSRGFSFRRDGPLDMRMGRAGASAAEIVNSYSEADLKRVFSQYGEERQAGRVARAVVRARDQQPLESTAELADVVRRAKSGHRGRIDPATQVFQALRIEANRELESLELLLDEVSGMLEQDGRLVVISYHSLEDRIVKNSLRRLAVGKIDEVTGRPMAETKLIEVLTKRPVRPTEAEVAANPRARSARLRAARRI